MEYLPAQGPLTNLSWPSHGARCRGLSRIGAALESPRSRVLAKRSAAMSVSESCARQWSSPRKHAWSWCIPALLTV